MRQSSEGEWGCETNPVAGSRVGKAEHVQVLSVPGPDTVPLLPADIWTFFVVCAKNATPNWPVDVSEIKEEDVSDEEVTGVQELPLELPAAGVAEQNMEGTPDDAVPEDGASLVESPYKWVVEAANSLYPGCAPAFSEALDMIESVSNRPLFLQLLLGD